MRRLLQRSGRGSNRQLSGAKLIFRLGGFLVAAIILWLAFSIQAQPRDTDAPWLRSPGPKPKPTSTNPPVIQLVAPSSNSITQTPTVAKQTAFGQFGPQTEAERELEKLLGGKDEAIDLVLANWLIAADLPEFTNITRQAYFAQVDSMIEQVRQSMARMQLVAKSRGKDIKAPDTRCNIFCNAITKLGFAYVEDFRKPNLTRQQMSALHKDPDNTFLAGLLRTKRGSCVSMPLIYLVIGQRLGFPVHLVAVGAHYFIRWEEPGYRMNIETTSVDKVRVTDEDLVYLEMEGMTRDQVKGSTLRNLSNREVVGNLFFTRSAYWQQQGVEHATQLCLDLSRAQHLCPDDPMLEAKHKAVFDYFGIQPGQTTIRITVPKRRHP